MIIDLVALVFLVAVMLIGLFLMSSLLLTDAIHLWRHHVTHPCDTPPSPPEGGSSCRPAHGPLSKDRSGSTS